MIKQFVPSGVCLKCQGCCRFTESNSVWLPCLLDEEIQVLLDKNIPPAVISAERKIQAVPCPGKEGFICPFLSPEDNKCRIYEFRPFECQLYPFLINMRNKKVVLTVDLNCHYAKEKLNSQEFKDYADFLIKLLNSPAQIKLLRDNPHVLQAYEEVSEIIELNF